MKSWFVFFLSILMFFSCSPEKEALLTENESSENDGKQTKVHLPKLPDFVLFCGDTLHLDSFDARERLDKELIVNTYFHSSTIQAFKRANRYFPELVTLLKQNNIPEDMKYLCLIESNLTQAVSPSGASGFWQFMPAAAEEYGLKVNREIDERLHIEKSTIAACSYLQKSHDSFGDWFLTAASYNCGPKGLSDALGEQQVDSYFDLYLNGETSRYVFRILAMKLIFEHPQEYGFFPEQYELYEPVRTRKISVNGKIDDLVKWSKEQGSNYRMLRILNPWIKGTRLTYHDEEILIELPK